MSKLSRKAKMFGILIGMMCFIITGMALIAVGKLSVEKLIDDHSWYTSEYSKYCYPRTIANSGIKTKIFYPTLESCGKPQRK